MDDAFFGFFDLLVGVFPTLMTSKSSRLPTSFAFRILLGDGDESGGGANSEELRFFARLGVDDVTQEPRLYFVVK